MKRNYQLLAVVAVSIILILSTTACGLGGQVDKPVVQISVPDEQFEAGLPIAVQVAAADTQGLAYVELMIDGQPFTTVAANPNETSLITSQFWTPELPGSHVIQARAFNSSNLVSDPVHIMVNVNEATVEVEPEPAQAEQPQQPVSDAEVIQVSTGDTLDPVVPNAEEEPIDTTPMITVLVDLNVRIGPGIDYALAGLLSGGESTQVTGKNADGTWFEIVYPVNSNTKGWVSANGQYVAAVNTETVPAVAAPALPTATPTFTSTPQPTATPLPTATQAPTHTPVPPTPEPVKPTIYSFTASQYTITKGESVTLQWDLANAQVAFLNYNGSDEGVVAPGSKNVAPIVDTVYTLIAQNEAGNTYAQVEIKVNPAPADPPGPVITPINPGKLIPILPTPTPKLKIVPGVIITPVPTLQLVPGVIIPKS